jgi:DNA-binding XRE family transcriptional regulator
LRFPKQKKEQKEITILCQMGIVTETDFARFLPFVKDATPAAAGFDLKAIREQAGLSQSELGKLVNLSQVEISRLEHGTKNISVDIQERILDAIKNGTKSNVVPFKKIVYA